MKLLKLTLVLIALHGGTAAVLAQKQQSVSVRIGKEAVVKSSGGLKIKFLEVTEDSRCPEGTNCIWAGVARVKVQLRRNGKTSTFELNTSQADKAAVFEGHQIILAGLTPHPRGDTVLQKSSYTAKFTVSKLSK